VVAGEVPAALALARYAATALCLDPAELYLAGGSASGTGIPKSHRISGPDEARRIARAMQVADVPHVVVLEAPVHRPDTAWVRAVRKALAPSAVWAAVDATRKTTETVRHLRGLGMLNALGVYGAMDCTDPASVLSLGVPVAVVDGRPADPHLWAALLSQRLYQPGGAPACS
jgi:hypothetical protein